MSPLADAEPETCALNAPNAAQPAVIVIDDQAAVRDALGETLQAFGYSVRTYASADAFLAAMTGAETGCVIADVRMPGTDGIELARELARRGSALPVVLISGHADVAMAVAAIKAGAEDLLEKPVSDARLLAAINRSVARACARPPSGAELQRRFGRLTAREAEVMDLVVEGLTSQAIAAQLDISARTVESYRVQVMDKMKAPNVAVLVRLAIRLGRLAP